jgi:FtsZ-interacting cell division protein ZipA
MSDLQLSLIVIGAMVIGAVVVYNWLQERNYRRKLEQAFGDAPADVLLDRANKPEIAGDRVEPRLQHAPAPEAARPTRNEAAETSPRFDQDLDYVADLEAGTPLSETAIEELLSKIAECGKPVRAFGRNAETGRWEEAAHRSGGRYGRLRLVLQLVNRGGAVNAAQLALFCDAVRSSAEKAGGASACPDAEAALRTARELDLFCSGVDVAVGVNVVAEEGSAFSGAAIRELAETYGFRLESDGVFHYRNEQRQTLFTLDNHEPAPFLPESIKQVSTRGITLMLDVPRVADGAAVLDGMLDIGFSIATALKGRLVDDNRSELSEAGVEKIREQLRSIHAALAARGMPAGGERALRLFS